MTLAAAFVAACLGHMVGDYLLQNQWIALTKSKPGRVGALACSLHVFLYTLAVSVFTGFHGLLFLAGVAIPHWLIDRYSLGLVFLNLKNSVKYHWENLYKWEKHESELRDSMWAIAFAAPVYIANDNSMHFVCLWLLLKYGLGLK